MKLPSDKPIYIAGPMTGLPQFNIPLFERVARELRGQGLKVISPVELDSQYIREEAIASPDGAMPASGKIGGETWGEILGRDVRVIADQIGGVVALPGWEDSRGARLEVFVAMLCKLPLFTYVAMPPFDPVPYKLYELDREDAAFRIARSFT